MIDPRDIDRLQRSMRARASAAQGEAGQALVGSMLRARGLALVERIETGVKAVRAFSPVAGRRLIVGARHTAKVSGDWRAVIPGIGTSVLVEVKLRRDDQLSLSDFEDHQIVALDAHHAARALSLVGWVHRLGPELLLWPIAGFVKGKPLTLDDDRVCAARWAWRSGT